MLDVIAEALHVDTPAYHPEQRIHAFGGFRFIVARSSHASLGGDCRSVLSCSKYYPFAAMIYPGHNRSWSTGLLFMDKNFDIGDRLHAVRIAAGLSQRQLAERAGVPHAQISQVETNKVSPSVSTLRKILSGLGMGMGDFFEPERSPPKGPFFSADELVDLTSRVAASPLAGAANGTLVFRQVGDARAHNLQILHEVYQPQADTGDTFLQHPSSEGGYVVEGELEITVGDQVRILKAGEAYLFDSRVPHRFRNLSSRPCVVISACSPPYL